MTFVTCPCFSISKAAGTLWAGCGLAMPVALSRSQGFFRQGADLYVPHVAWGLRRECAQRTSARVHVLVTLLFASHLQVACWSKEVMWPRGIVGRTAQDRKTGRRVLLCLYELRDLNILDGF